MIPRARIKQWQALRTREGRRDQGCFLAEGVRALEEALRFGKLPQSVLWAPERASERDRRLVDDLPGEVELCELSARDLDRVADARTPSGSIGVFERPATRLGEAEPGARTLILDGVSDPGNAGSLLRSALAFACPQVILSEDSVDPWQPKVVRSTAGALFGLELHRAPRAEVVDFLERSGTRLVVTARDGTDDPEALARLAAGPRLALAIGSEARGVHADLMLRAALRLSIRHTDAVESLNAAVAGSIVLHSLYTIRAPR